MKPSLNDRLFSAIFGPEPSVQEMEQRKACQRAADKKEALRLCQLAQVHCTFGKTERAKWLPATIYDNPAAVAILDDSTVVKAAIENEGFYALDQFDINNTEVFDDR